VVTESLERCDGSLNVRTFEIDDEVEIRGEARISMQDDRDAPHDHEAHFRLCQGVENRQDLSHQASIIALRKERLFQPRMTVIFLPAGDIAVPTLVLWLIGGIPEPSVEDHQPACWQAEAVELFQAVVQRIACSLAPDLQFDSEHSGAITETEVHASTADGVLAFESSRSIHDPMKKRHQNEVRRDFVVRGGAEQRLSMLAPEGKEGCEEPLRIEGSLECEPRRPDGRQGILRSECQHPRNDLG